MRPAKDDRPFGPLFLHIAKQINDMLREELGGNSIHFGQARVLVALKDHARLTQTAIGKGLDIKSSTVTNMLKKMEASGLVVRVPDENDDRVLNVSLTDEGHQAVHHAKKAIAKVERNIMKSLAGINIEELRPHLEAVRDGLGGRHPEV